MEKDSFSCKRGLPHFLKALEIVLKSPQSYDKRIKGTEFPESNFSSSFHVIRRLLYKNSSEVVSEEFSWDASKLQAGFGEGLRVRLEGIICFTEYSLDKRLLRDKLADLCGYESSLLSPMISLKLISLEKYEGKYKELKGKYYEALKGSWCERTDPEKFIPEDLGIASYLLCLWEQERNELGVSKKQSFVDLGCGNGLLVYLLNKEGHPGTGLDVRKRKIWDVFSDIDLREHSIIASVDTVYPQYDWLIGNHSDELTPWIPVMSTLSSEKSRFFLLPCCAFEFYSKFNRRDPSLGMYTDYLNYVEEICAWAGFDVQRDRLKIPSTKRICFVGNKRKNSPSWAEAVIDIKNKLNSLKGEFKPREKVEAVRNCTKVDPAVLGKIVNIIVEMLLSKPPSSGEWNPGLTLPIGKLASKIPSDLLTLLKNECGGLQTLLRNHHYIFYVSKGCVRFRIPGKDNPPKKSDKVKTKPCWFIFNHPDGCPASVDDCLWLHPKT